MNTDLRRIWCLVGTQIGPSGQTEVDIPYMTVPPHQGMTLALVTSEQSVPMLRAVAQNMVRDCAAAGHKFKVQLCCFEMRRDMEEWS